MRNWLTLSVLLWTGAQADKDHLRQLGEEAAKLRGLSYRPVVAQVVSQKECADYLLHLLDEEMTPALTQKREGFLKLLGLMPESASMKKIYAELYTDQVRGLYDAKRKRYLVVGGKSAASAGGDMEALAAGMGLSTENILTVHELGHAIQDQHFQLGPLTQRVANDFDQELAASCLIEGDASVLMMDYAMKSIGMDAEALGMGGIGGMDQEQMMLGSSPALARAPRFFREVLGFPYSQGMKFVGSLRRGKDWNAVNRAWKSLPESTEQTLHPEKYGRDHPKSVQVQGSVAGTSLGQDTAGEFLIRTWAREMGGSDEAAAGWGGDRYEVFRTSKGVCALWSTVWDSDKDAREFETLALQAMTTRLGKPRSPGRWSVSGKNTTVERHGRQVELQLSCP